MIYYLSDLYLWSIYLWSPYDLSFYLWPIYLWSMHVSLIYVSMICLWSINLSINLYLPIIYLSMYLSISDLIISHISLIYQSLIYDLCFCAYLSIYLSIYLSFYLSTSTYLLSISQVVGSHCHGGWQVPQTCSWWTSDPGHSAAHLQSESKAWAPGELMVS
jgi:hypothetical protein